MRRQLLCALCIVVLGGSSIAQEKEWPEVPARMQESASSKELDVLRIRGRQILHKGEPLDLGGIEEGGNDFRSRTPALANHVKESTQVDLDEVYRRKMAMYSTEERFSAPLALAVLPGSLPHGGGSGVNSTQEATSVPESEPTEDEGGFPWGIAFTLAAVAAVVVIRRRS